MPNCLNELRADIKYAVRQLLAAPSFTAVAAATLAVGIGATTAIFSVVYAVILHPLPFAEPDRVVVIAEDFNGQPGGVSGGNFNDWRTRARSFEHLAAFHLSNFNVASGDVPQRLVGARTTHEFFAVFGVPPLYGRTYTADEDRPGREQVVVLSHRLWVRQFGSDPSRVGTEIRMDGRPYTIIGVMPPDFDRMAMQEELWVPAAFTAERLAMHDEHFMTGVARLAPGVTPAQATGDLQAITRQVRTELPADTNVRGALIDSMASQLVGDVRERLLVLFGAVSLVLLIACGNVAHLLLARGGVRAHEIALRTALGAGRGRMIRQLLTETFVLALLGATLGVAVVHAAVPVLVAMSPAGVPRLEQAAVNTPVLLFALLASMLSAVVAGLAPAVASTRPDLRTTLNEGGRSGRASRERLRFALVAGEVAVALILLVGAGLLVRSALRMQAVDPGFNPTGVLSARVSLPAAGYEDPARLTRTFEQIAETLADASSVEAGAVTSSAPMAPEGGSNGLVPEGKTFDPNDFVLAQLSAISADYLAVMQIAVVAGRPFADTDRRNAPLVMLLNETAARQLFPAESAVGKRVACCEPAPDGGPGLKTVVGIVRDVRRRSLQLPPEPEFYLPLAQAPPALWNWNERTMTVVVRGRGVDAATMTGAVRDAVRQADPTVPLYNIATMEQRVQTVMAQSRFNTMLMLILGACGLLLAAIGIYGVITYFVAQQQRELAIRVALGAQSKDVVRLVVAEGMRPVALGLTLGVLGALAASQVLAAYVFDITTRDPLTMVVVVALLLATALMATLIPARRATRVNLARTLTSG